MSDNQPPSFNSFLAAPVAEIAALAPATIVFAVAGTRRAAALAGISPESDTYARWTIEQMIDCVDLLFRYGVQHVFITAVTPSQFSETGFYRDRLLAWLRGLLLGPDTSAEFRRRQWRIRLLGADSLPELADTKDRVEGQTAQFGGPTLWFSIVPDRETIWRWILDAVHRSGARARGEVVQVLYGEPVPPASIFLSFGKPIVTPDLLPPLLMEKVHCYWTQRPGYSLTEGQFRAILYDYLYLRPTWRQDKSGRADEALLHRAMWEDGPTLGLGRRLGSFWYPAPFEGETLPEDADRSDEWRAF